jgi:hypothetical protein
LTGDVPGKNCYQFLPTGGRKSPDNVWQLLMKNHRIANNSTTSEAREKKSNDLESLEFQTFFDVGFTKLKNNQILLKN